jgi:SAM-dependent methyltransferase
MLANADPDPRHRFSGRAAHYARWRPPFPREIVDILAREIGLTPAWRITDVASGTGAVARLFLENGNEVWGVEPNAEMRSVGEQALAGFPRFHSVDAVAEATTLPAASVDLVTVGRALHWLDIPRARAEFRRILRPPGWVAVLGSRGRGSGLGLPTEIRDLLHTWAIDPQRRHDPERREENLRSLFGPDGWREAEFSGTQSLDLEGLRGRLLSASSAPLPGHPNHEPMMRALEEIFARLQRDGRVTFPQGTRLLWGRIT